MKVVITESKLKTYIRDKFGVDLTGRIEFEPESYELLVYFDKYLTKDGLERRRRMDNYGPIYLIKLKGGIKIFYQMNYSSDNPLILSNEGDTYTQSEFREFLGIQKLAITMDQFLNLYS
jgi:hypothetical protein